MNDERERTNEAETGRRAMTMDRHVGGRIRERRTMLGISQQQLAHTIGVTYQQANKYERGMNRISAGRLFEIATALGVPINWFFEGLSTDPLEHDNSPSRRMCLELARNFAAIDNARHQEAISQLARTLAAQSATIARTGPSHETEFGASREKSGLFAGP